MAGVHSHIVVVGGGVTGASVAWHLLARGFERVTLLERDRLGSGTTWHSAGNITWKPAADADEPIDYMLELIPRLEAQTGQSTGWLRTGRLFLSRCDDTMAVFAGYHERALASGVAGALLDPLQACVHHPLLCPEPLVGAWLNPRSGRVNPADLVAAFARGIRQRGGVILENTRVLELCIDDGVARGVITPHGRIEAEIVVVATGLWSRQLLAQHDIALAHGVCEHFYAIANVSPPLPRHTPSFICAERLVYGREESAGFLVGFFDRNAKVVDVSALPEPFTFTLLDEDWDQVGCYYREAAELFPALTDAPIRLLLNGPEAFTADGRPLVGAVPGLEGLLVACALNSAGVTYSGMVGHNVADLVQGLAPRFKVFDCEPARFPAAERAPSWVDTQMPAAPSRAYSRHHR